MVRTTLTDATCERIEALFPSLLLTEAIRFLEYDCANNLPSYRRASAKELERVWFAALKISEGNIERLKDAITLAQTDWRDLLVTAGFADDIHAYEKWSP
jgi:hypothetical protein